MEKKTPEVVKEITKPELKINLQRVEVDKGVVANSIRHKRVVKLKTRAGNSGSKCDGDNNLRSKLKKPSPPSTKPVSNRCQYCCKFCSTAEELLEHESTHTVNKEQKCPDCGIGFSRRSYLVEHACIHNGEKPHKCYYCNRAFTLRCNLVRHVRIHTGEKPYMCSICKNTFILKKNMVEHERTHTGEKPFKCLHCDFSFSRRSSLVRHSSIHTGEKSFKCHECHKSFPWKYYLNRHMSMHLKSKPETRKRRNRKCVEVFVDEELQVTKTDSEPKLTDPIPSPVEDWEMISIDEEMPEEQEDDKSGIEICDFKPSQEIDIVPVYQRKLTVELPNRTSSSSLQADKLHGEGQESDESAAGHGEIIKFKMTTSEFDHFCKKRLLVLVPRLKQLNSERQEQQCSIKKTGSGTDPLDGD